MYRRSLMHMKQSTFENDVAKLEIVQKQLLNPFNMMTNGEIIQNELFFLLSQVNEDSNNFLNPFPHVDVYEAIFENVVTNGKNIPFATINGDRSQRNLTKLKG